MPTSSNPFIEASEIEAARVDMSEAAFNQEYLALFVNWEGAVFRRVLEVATAEPQRGPIEGHSYVMGCDWGRTIDYTVFVVIDATSKTMVAMDRSNQVDYVVQRGRLMALHERWKPHAIIAEANSIGGPVIEQLLREKLPVRPFTTSNATKAATIEALTLAFERDDLQILRDPVLVGELQAYQAETLPSGLLRYGAPSGMHDDTVMALAMAWHGVVEKRVEPRIRLFTDGDSPGPELPYTRIESLEQLRFQRFGRWG
jgi:Terminase RNaseH-like domain